MTDDSIQFAASSLAQLRAHGTMRESVGDETVAGDVFRHGPKPGRAEEGSRVAAGGEILCLARP